MISYDDAMSFGKRPLGMCSAYSLSRSPSITEDKGFYIAVAELRGWALWEASKDCNDMLTNAITKGMTSGW